MLTDSELLQHLHHVLQTSDLDTATAATVRRRLEQDLGIDLSDKKPFIRHQIDLYLQSHYHKEEEKEDEESENVIDNDASASDDEEIDAEEEEDIKTNNKHNKSTPDVKKKGRGFSKPCALSPQLQKLIGEPELARTEVVKRIWAYIKEKDLQNPQNKRKILCDETLHEIFRVKTIDMFQMNKALTKHIWPIDEEYAREEPSDKPKNEKPKNEKPKHEKPKNEKPKQNKRAKEDEDEPEETGKRQKAKGSGFASPKPISGELVQFLGTGENELSRAEVVKRMWEYIKKNKLQDPSDKRRILCDDKLKELFKVDTFIGFTVSKLLTTHFIKEKE